MTIDIVNESGETVGETALAAVARYALDRMRIHPLAELSVLIVDEAAMTELHERWMGEPGPTDVLSFPMDELRPPSPVAGTSGRGGDEPGPDLALLGDVVLCPQVAAAQAKEAGHSAQQELELLTVHGILHLLGYDHADPEEEAAMFGLQGQILTAWRAGSGGSAAGTGAAAGASGSATQAAGAALPDTEGPAASAAPQDGEGTG